METAGVEPASEGIVTYASTCVVYLLNLDVTLPINRRCRIQSVSSLLRALRRRGWSVACLVWDPESHPHKRWMSGSAGHLGCCELCVSFASYRRLRFNEADPSTRHIRPTYPRRIHNVPEVVIGTLFNIPQLGSVVSIFADRASHGRRHASRLSSSSPHVCRTSSSLFRRRAGTWRTRSWYTLWAG